MVPEPGSEVWGVVYEVSKSDSLALDRKEGVNVGAYARRTVAVVTPTGDPLNVMTYCVVDRLNPLAPSQDYFDLILRGARNWSLPEDHIERLAEYVGELNSWDR